MSHYHSERPEGVTIFRCENGYGVELISSNGSHDEEQFMVKRYIAKTLEEVQKMVEAYFNDQEII